MFKGQLAWDPGGALVSVPPAGKSNLMFHFEACQGESPYLGPVSLFVLFSPLTYLTDWMWPTHMREGNLLYSVYLFTCQCPPKPPSQKHPEKFLTTWLGTVWPHQGDLWHHATIAYWLWGLGELKEKVREGPHILILTATVRGAVAPWAKVRVSGAWGASLPTQALPFSKHPPSLRDVSPDFPHRVGLLIIQTRSHTYPAL